MGLDQLKALLVAPVLIWKQSWISKLLSNIVSGMFFIECITFHTMISTGTWLYNVIFCFKPAKLIETCNELLAFYILILTQINSLVLKMRGKVWL